MSSRKTAKLIVFSIGLILTSPLIFGSWVEKVLTGSEQVFVTFSQLLSWAPGLIGSYLRAAYYFGTLEHCSWEVHIGFGCVFSHRGAGLANRVSMGAYCVIGLASIGSNVRLASRISIPSGKRQHLTDRGELGPTTRYDRVAIGSGCWLGEGAIIMANVGDQSIVSAGAVVTSEVPHSCIVGGNPATVLKKLDSGSSDLTDI